MEAPIIIVRDCLISLRKLIDWNSELVRVYSVGVSSDSIIQQFSMMNLLQQSHKKTDTLTNDSEVLILSQ